MWVIDDFIMWTNWINRHSPRFVSTHVSDVILCQSIVRRHQGRIKSERMQHERCVKAATRIQAEWRSTAASKSFSQIKTRVILFQSTARTLIAMRRFVQYKIDAANTLQLQNDAATKVSSTWRRWWWNTKYRRTIRGTSSSVNDWMRLLYWSFLPLQSFRCCNMPINC